MSWKFKIEARKSESGYTISPIVVKAPAPGVYGGWTVPHKEWQKAIEHLSESLESQHEEGDTYSVDGVEYTDFREALKNLKEPTS